MLEFLIITLILIYLLNPLEGEEKTITTPFLTIIYIISLSYILQLLNIKLYKILYIAILVFLLIMLSITNKIRIEKPKLNPFLLIIILLSVILSITIFPKYPCEMWDSQYHSYKIKAIFLSQSIFYNNPYCAQYLHYPSGFHLLIYYSIDDFREIPYTIYIFEILFIIMFILANYYIGKIISNDELKIFSAFFALISYEYYRILLRAIWPNTLGFILFLFTLGIILRYDETKSEIYLFIYSLSLLSLIFTHSFPTIMLILLLVSYLIWKLIYKEIDKIKNIVLFSIPSVTIALIIIYTKIFNSFISYVTPNHINKSIGYSLLLIALISGISTCSFIVWIISGTIDYLIESSIYIILFILGCIFLLKKRLGFIVFYVILVMVWAFVFVLPTHIPLFSSLYNPIRWYYIMQCIMPLFYSAGCYYIFKNNKFLALIVILVVSLCFSFSFYSLDKYHKYYLINDDIANFLKNLKIKDKYILNFGQDSGQFIYVFSNNYNTFCYGNGNKFNNVSANTIINYTFTYNYNKFIQFCNLNNISYIFISNKSNVNINFFMNKSYFEILNKSKSYYFIKLKNK
ncbi:hypothetical protein [Methanocaldococcus sp.]